MPRGDQISRQWRVLKRIENAGAGGITVERLSRDEESSRRTIYRDVQDLSAAGFPVVRKKRKGAPDLWVLAPSHRQLLSVPFSYAELLAMFVAYDAMKIYAGTPIFDGIESVYRKLRAAIPPETAGKLRLAEKRFVAHGTLAVDYARHREKAETINRAILDGESLVIDYFTLYRQARGRRKIDPYYLQVNPRDGALYLLAWDHGRKTVRTFALQRIHAIERTGERFSPDPGFSLERFLNESFGVFHDPPRKIAVRFSKKVAPLILERTYHPTQRTVREKDGSVLLTMETGGLEEVKRWIRSFGEDAKVVEPESLGS